MNNTFKIPLNNKAMPEMLLKFCKAILTPTGLMVVRREDRSASINNGYRVRKWNFKICGGPH